MKNGFSIYDAHTHIGIARHSGRNLSAAELVAKMDDYGVDRALVIPFPVVEDRGQAHDEIARAVGDYPDRLSGVACLDPFAPEQDFRAELRRCAEDLGFCALKLQPQYQALNPISSRAEFFFEAAFEHRLPIVAHTGTGIPFALPSLFIMPARKFPELKIILAHCGGSVYFAEAIVAASVCPNIFLEVSSLMPHHILEILQHVPSSRLMIGSDVPESVDAEIGKILTLEISDESKQDILFNTARRLFEPTR
jgi:predicted TIM-barrel fold metal-dependent hydrolase